MCLSPRPHFPCAADYLQHVRDCLAAGRRYCLPTSAGELAALKSELPHIYAEFKPSDHDLAMIVKQCRLWSMVYGRDDLADAADLLEHDPKPQSDAEFETLLLKLFHDDDAKAALSSVLTGGPAL